MTLRPLLRVAVALALAVAVVAAVRGRAEPDRRSGGWRELSGPDLS